MSETEAVRRARAERALEIAEQLISEADRDKAAAAVKHFDEEGGMHPPTYCLGVATLAAHAMARSDDPKLLRATLFIMIDRQFADAEFIRQSEEAAGEMQASLANQEPAGSA